MHDFTLSSRFDINDNWLIKMEMHFFEGLRGVEIIDENYDDSWNLFALKTSYSF